MDATRNRRDILEQCALLSEGQSMEFDGAFFREAFPWNPLTGRPTRDAFLESMIGANWGAWEVWQSLEKDTYIVTRHPIGDTRMRQDWDRR